jgi:intracellular sulfur oxidation DsrE/DsrF family protein
MAKYLLIESRDRFDSNDVGFCHDVSRRLAQRGDDVTLFLVQNGVMPARPSAGSEELSKLATSGVTVLADAFSLRERGISETNLAPGVNPASLDVVIDRLADGAKAIWH